MNDWARLYQAAIRIRESAPWEWLDEGQIFGVQDPDSGEIGFVSIMGSLGEHYAVASYTGSTGLYGFWSLQRMDTVSDAGMVLEVPQLQVSFEDRSILTPKDLHVIKQLDLKFRGRGAWPMFRSYRPGYFPWYLESDEIRAFTYVLEQTLAVVARAKGDPDLLEPGDDTSYLVRVAEDKGGVLVWDDHVVSVMPPEPESVSVPMDMAALNLLKGLPKSQVSLEVDLSFFPGRIGAKGERPQYAYVLMLVDSNSGFVFGGELLSPDPTFVEMCGTIPMVVARTLAGHRLRPREIRVRSQTLLPWLRLLGDDLGFKMTQRSRLPRLDEARDSLNAWLH